MLTPGPCSTWQWGGSCQGPSQVTSLLGPLYCRRAAFLSKQSEVLWQPCLTTCPTVLPSLALSPPWGLCPHCSRCPECLSPSRLPFLPALYDPPCVGQVGLLQENTAARKLEQQTLTSPHLGACVLAMRTPGDGIKAHPCDLILS